MMILSLGYYSFIKEILLFLILRRVLLEAGADIDKQGQLGVTALIAAVELSERAVVRLLIEVILSSNFLIL